MWRRRLGSERGAVAVALRERLYRERTQRVSERQFLVQKKVEVKVVLARRGCMSLTADDFAEFVRDDDDDDSPLGNALAEIAVDVDMDSVEAVRNLRERT